MLVAVKTASATQTSRNWSGYVINSNGITAISASWTVPEIHCPTGSTQMVSAAVSVWIGIDGLSGVIPEQVGTNGLCVNGSATYLAWEEDATIKSGSQPSFSEISSGDQITASIAYLGNSQFRLKIADVQSGDSRTYTVIIPNTARASAEWIVEDPWYTVTGSYLPLPTFQQVTFSDCSAAVNNVAGSILQNNAVPLSMTDSNHNIIVTPQGLNQAGTSFQVTQVGSAVPEAPLIPGLLLPAFVAGLLVLRKKKLT